MKEDNGPEIDIRECTGLYAAPKENAPFNAYMARVTKAAKENCIEEYYQNEKSKLEENLKLWVGDSYKEPADSVRRNISALEEAYRIVKKGGNSKNIIKICPKCGIEYENSAKFCGECGQLLILMQCACGEIFLKKEDGSFDKFCMKCGQMNPLEQAKEEKRQKQENERQHREYINSLKAGDIIEFGSYPFETDGTEKPIEWIILERYSDDTALLISKYCLDARRFDSSSNNWEESGIRAWLNDSFYNKAFDEKERDNIIESNVVCEENSNYTVTDKIFLLSTDEANKYFKNNDDRKAYPTPYAKARGAYTNADLGGSCWWWLRSPGNDQDGAASVSHVGGVGSYVFDDYAAVRVALKINLNNL